MSDEKLVPANVHRAAKRGFIRTAAQSLAGGIPAAGITLALTSDWLLAVALGAASAIITALLAGTASYLSIIADGIPADYAPDLDGGYPLPEG